MYGKITLMLLSVALMSAPMMMGCESKPLTAKEIAGFEVANVAAAQVKEVKRADGRYYAHISEAQWEFWIMTKTPLEAGQHVLLGKGAQRTGYTSEALDQRFESILELEQVKVITQAQSERLVRLPIPEGGQDIASIFERRGELDGQQVKVRGRVVKVNKNIFETNWYHLQDGTGAKGTNDLTVTSTQEFEVGQVVVAAGKLTKDHNLGFGYRYDAIILDAALGTQDDPAQALPTAPSTKSSKNMVSAAVGAPAINWSARVDAQYKAQQAQAQGPAPSMRVLGLDGLELGLSQAPELEQWLIAHGLDCPAQRSPQRTASQHRCQGKLKALPERAHAGALTQLMLSHGDGQPLGQLSMVHEFGLPGQAITDYTSQLERMTKALGEPLKSKPLHGEDALKGEIVRYESVWQFETLRAELSLMKISGRITLTERWEWTQDRSRHQMRADAKPIHGAKSPAKNPHALHLSEK